MSDSLKQAVPEGWMGARLADVTLRVTNIKPEEEPNRVFRYVDISGINNETFEIVDTREFHGMNAPSRAKRPIRSGDVLFSNVRTYLKNIAVVPDELDNQVASTGFTVLSPNGAVLTRYLYRWVLTDQFVDTVTPQQTGSSYPATTDRVVREQRIPLPPLAEQKRMVAKLEALLARVRSVHQRLVAVPGILKRFRQTVLAHACSGKLTEGWREEPLDASEDFPDGWEVINAGRIYEDARYGTSQKCSIEKIGVPVLRVPNIARGVLDLNDLKYANLPDREREKLRLRAGDIIVCRTNGSLDLVGKAAVIPANVDNYAFASYLIRLRLDLARVVPAYFHAFLLSTSGRDQIETTARSTAGQFNLNLEILRCLRFGLPPIAEQREIVRRVEILFALADSIEQRVQGATKRADTLPQSILARAFRGELVPTEAELAYADGREYETAERLLARVREELVQREPEKTRRKTPKRKKVSMKRSPIEVLLETKKALTPEKVFHESGCDQDDVDTFYHHLRTGIESGRIVQDPKKPDPKNPKVLLRAKRD